MLIAGTPFHARVPSCGRWLITAVSKFAVRSKQVLPVAEVAFHTRKRVALASSQKIGDVTFLWAF